MTERLTGIVVLSQMRADERDELQLYLHMSSSKGKYEGGSGDRVCQLRMSGMCVE